MSKRVYEKTYFQHDHYARQDPKIKNVLAYFRREGGEDRAKAAVCVYWWIIEDMHIDEYRCEDIEGYADDYRCDVDFLKTILENFDLFRVENGCYISDRVLRNLEEQQEKIDKKQEAANIRWVLSAFAKAYEKEFGQAPVLASDEIEALRKYSKSIPDFRTKLPDIIYTLRNLKFDTDINFKPCANWLLAKNNLTRLINGEFGGLKHRKTEKEIRADEEKRAAKNAPDEMSVRIKTCSGKAEALTIIKELCGNQPADAPFINPAVKMLMKKFDIRAKEIPC